MKKKFYAVGEVFKHEDKTLKVVKYNPLYLDCALCTFDPISMGISTGGACGDVPFECRKDHREDLIGVHFEEVKDES